jgi:hypothetical protein
MAYTALILDAYLVISAIVRIARGARRFSPPMANTLSRGMVIWPGNQASFPSSNVTLSVALPS